MGGMLGSSDARRASLRELFDAGETVLAPGCYDALGARLVEEAGFPAAYVTGFGSAASHLGRPDIGLMSLPEMVDQARRIAGAIDIPVVADADTGYGNSINVIRTVREYEAAGVAAIHIEDQVMPKKCGHMEGKEVVPAREMVAKVQAAVAARRSPDFLIIARTDARAVAGLDEAIGRANAALEAGADMAFVEAPQTMDELAAVPKRVAGPCLLNVVRGGKTPEIDLRAAQAMGYRLAIVPGLLLKAVIGACDTALAELKATHVHPAPRGDMTVRDAFNRVGAAEWDVLRTRFRDNAVRRAAE